MINEWDVKRLDLKAYIIGKKLVLTVWQFIVIKDVYSVLEVTHHPIGHL